ncbi:MAG: hypothetical protein HZB51_18580 [Chloroflexi bacterium]|nr:hypothetical protein [Chloroflexota bacterium]
MKIPNREHAVIASEKIVEYLLNTEHRRGGSKARLLAEFGYTTKNWQRLESDIRMYHLSVDVNVTRITDYGTRYEIHAPIETPIGRSLWVRTIWQIDEGKDYPRLITLVPD